MPKSDQPLTFQSSGILSAMLVKKGLTADPSGATNGVYQVRSSQIVYGPANAPPPAWTGGGQYTDNTPLECLPYGTKMVDSGGYIYSYGGMVCSVLNDMSNNSVLPGKTYAFSVQVYPTIQSYFVVTGVEGGATIVPGFGIRGLKGQPSGYTYITPQTFTGDWQIGLISPFSGTILWLAVEYVPPRDYTGDGTLSSWLTFTLSGTVSMNNFNSGNSLSPSPDEAVNEIYRASSPYHLNAFDRFG